MNNTMGRFGGAFGVAIVTAVFTAHGSLLRIGGRFRPGTGRRWRCRR